MTEAAPTVEQVKSGSGRLRGDLAVQLDAVVPDVDESGAQLLKFHGVYAQDDRDVRRERAAAGEPLEFIYMVRVAVPGGRLSADQWLALDGVARDVADGSIRLTTRQGVQFHGVAKRGLRPLARSIDARLLTSFGACGDVVRNTVMCPDLAAGVGDADLAGVAPRIAARFRPASRAWWEVFVGGERVAARESAEHDFYGEAYLPRKFKIAVAHPDENCVDVLAQDVGLVPGVHPVAGPGFTVLVGGGLGRSYAHPDTFARLAEPLAFATDGELEPLVAAIVAAYRDLGDRTERRRARLKYVIADAGLAAFAREVASRVGFDLRAPLAFAPSAGDDHLGWREGAGGRWRLGVRVGAGRVRDASSGRGLRSALALVAAELGPTFVITAQQDLVIAGVDDAGRARVDEVLAAHGVAPAESLRPVERTALACPALPTCGQALTEGERRLPEAVGLIQAALDERGLARRPLQLRMTGCPNGCARGAVAEVAIVGRTKTTYDVYVGGGPRGDRLARPLAERVALEGVPGVLAPLLDRWRDEAGAEEGFGDFVTRVGV